MLRTIYGSTLTVNMCKSTEDTTRTVTRLLDIIALCRLVNLGMELLLGTSMTIRAGIALLTISRLTPFFSMLHVWTRCRSTKKKFNYHHNSKPQWCLKLNQDRGCHKNLLLLFPYFPDKIFFPENSKNILIHF